MTIQQLILCNCELNLKSIIALITNLSDNHQSPLLHLDIGRPMLYNYKNDEICDCVCSRLLLSPYCQLQVLEMRYCNITDQGAILLTQALMQNKTLMVLNLEWLVSFW